MSDVPQKPAAGNSPGHSGGPGGEEARRRAHAAFSDLEAALRQATMLLSTLKGANARLKRQNAELTRRLGELTLHADRLAADAEEARVHEAAPREAATLAASTPVSELAGRVVALEEQRRDWLRDRRRLAERVEGILDKLEYLQSETSSN